jgi:hypothetical protein
MTFVMNVANDDLESPLVMPTMNYGSTVQNKDDTQSPSRCLSMPAQANKGEAPLLLPTMNFGEVKDED